MYYYEIALLKSPLDPLTYQSDQKISLGVIVDVQLQRRAKLSSGVVVKEVKKPSFKCTDISNITKYYLLKDNLNLANFISKYYVSSYGEALSIFIPNYKIEKQYQNQKYDIDIALSSEQQIAYDFIQNNATSLLFANTGSGKTEIYIKLIENILNQNKQAVLLIPEISLSAQMEQRLKKVFQDSVAIWHSKISKKKKDEVVNNLLIGKTKLIAGARSALFLPYDNLGLIIVDEEHDDSYKSEQKPRINVKDLSIYMGKTFNIQVVLGSATPSLTSFYKIPYIRIKETYFQTNKKILFDNSPLELNNTIVEEIRKTLEKNEQVIVFLPTRANFKYQICGSCGKSIECPYCSVSLSLHKSSNALVCHYCNYIEAIPKSCPYCTVGKIENYRLGTAEVYEKLQTIFSKNIVEKFDKDSITTTAKLKKVLKDFNDHKVDILVGTQMLSKGHDYHNVTLAVVLGIDSVLNMTSYKVREKALSLLIQIAGRSGRKGYGEVLIQTQNIEFFDTYLQELDYEDFLKNELKERKGLYPPYFKLARVTFAHKNSSIAKKELDFYINEIKNIKDVQIVGYGESNIFKIALKYRYELLLRSKNIKQLLQVLHFIKSPNASIDIDTLY